MQLHYLLTILYDEFSLICDYHARSQTPFIGEFYVLGRGNQFAVEVLYLI